MDISLLADALPPAYTEPLSSDWTVEAGVPVHLRDAFREMIADDPPMLVVASRSFIDVGAWFRPARLWLVVGAVNLHVAAFGWGLVDRLYLGDRCDKVVAPLRESLMRWAVADHPFVLQIAFDELTQAIFNHLTGKLLLQAGDIRAPALRMDPLAAYQVLAQIEYGKASHA